MRLLWHAGGLARVLPYLAHGNAAAQAALLDHYAACLDLTALDAAGPTTPPHQVTLNVPPCISLTALYIDSTAYPGLQNLVVVSLRIAVSWDLLYT